jgi:cell division protein FtsZ
MARVSPEIESFTRIKVMGIGNSGTNSVNHMVRSRIKGVEFITVDTDAQKLHLSLASKKIHIGKNLTRGLGGGMNPEIGKKAAEETKEAIQETLKGADMVFIACGFGGGTASGAAPVVAKIAKEQGILTIAIVTRPFTFEGAFRARIAEEALMNLRDAVDAMIIIPNDRLFGLINKETSFLSAFQMCDDVLKQAVEGISDLITMPGIINLDFADVKAVMQNAGSALMGIGSAQGENRAEEAAKMAINSPLLDLSIDGAKGVLFAISGGENMTMLEVQSAANIITESIDSDAKVIFGAINDDRLKKDEIRVTVIASGFPEGKNIRKPSLFQNIPLHPVENENSAEKEKGGNKEKEKIRQLAEEKLLEEDEESQKAIPAFLRRKK